MSITLASGSTYVDGGGGSQDTLVFNVRDYGALGDGVNDDAPAFSRTITAAAADGGSVYVPDGRYALITGVDVTTDLRMSGPGIILQKYDEYAIHFAPAWGAEYAVTAQSTVAYPYAALGDDDLVTRLTVDAAALATGEYARDTIFKIWSNDTYPYVAAMTASQKNWLSENVKIMDVDLVNNYIYCDRVLEDTYTTTPKIRSAPTEKLYLDIFGDTYNPTGYPTLPTLVTSITRSGTTATMTVPAGTLDVPTGTLIGIEGASENIPGTVSVYYNGIFAVTRVSATVYTYTMTGTPATNATLAYGGIYAALGGRLDMILVEGSVDGYVKIHSYDSWRGVVAFRSGYNNRYDVITENQIDIPGAGGYGYGLYPDGSEYGLKGDVFASRTRHAFTTNIQKATTFSNSNYIRHGVPLRCGVSFGYALGGIGADWDTHEGARYTFYDYVVSEECRRGQTGSIQGSGSQNRGEGTKFGTIHVRGASRGIKESSQQYPFGRLSYTTYGEIILEDIDSLGFEMNCTSTYITPYQPQVIIDNIKLLNVGNSIQPDSGFDIDAGCTLHIKEAYFDNVKQPITAADSATLTTSLVIDSLRMGRIGTATTDEWIRGNRGLSLSIDNAVFSYTNSTSTRAPIRLGTGNGTSTVTIKQAHIIPASTSAPQTIVNVTASSGGAHTCTANIGRITTSDGVPIALSGWSSGNSNAVVTKDITMFPQPASFSADMTDTSITYNAQGIRPNIINAVTSLASTSRLVTLAIAGDSNNGSTPYNGARETTYRSPASVSAFGLGTGSAADVVQTNTVIAFTGTVVTITLGSAHGYAVNDLVRVSSSSTAMQGIHRISSVPSSTTYTFSCPAPSGTTPGTSQRVLSRLYTPAFANHIYDSVAGAWVNVGITRPYGTVIVPALPPLTANITLDYKCGFVAMNATGGNLTATLPAAKGYGDHVFTVKKTDVSANTVTLSCADNIDGATTAVISAQYGVIKVISDNVQWWTM